MDIGKTSGFLVPVLLLVENKIRAELLRHMKVARAAEIPIVGKALYGFKEAPKWWARYRDEVLSTASFATSEGQARLQKTASDENLWQIMVSGNTVIGHVLVYVDDLLVVSKWQTAKSFHEWVKQRWQCSDLEGAGEAKALRFLGIDVYEERDDQGPCGFSLAQEGYIDELVRSHNLSRSCRSNVPVPKEWVREAPIEEVDFTDETLKAAQRITGELLWVSQRTRVDIAFGVGLMSSWTTKAPAFVTKEEEDNDHVDLDLYVIVKRQVREFMLQRDEEARELRQYQLPNDRKGVDSNLAEKVEAVFAQPYLKQVPEAVKVAKKITLRFQRRACSLSRISSYGALDEYEPTDPGLDLAELSVDELEGLFGELDRADGEDEEFEYLEDDRLEEEFREVMTMLQGSEVSTTDRRGKAQEEHQWDAALPSKRAAKKLEVVLTTRMNSADEVPDFRKLQSSDEVLAEFIYSLARANCVRLCRKGHEETVAVEAANPCKRRGTARSQSRGRRTHNDNVMRPVPIVVCFRTTPVPVARLLQASTASSRGLRPKRAESDYSDEKDVTETLTRYPSLNHITMDIGKTSGFLVPVLLLVENKIRAELLRHMKVARAAEIPIVGKALYGFKEAPKWWARYRDEVLSTASFATSEGQARLQKTASDENLWQIMVSGNTVIGHVLVYVDDLLVVSKWQTAKSFHEWVKQRWQCSDLEGAGEAKALRFLGIDVYEERDDQGPCGFSLAQEGYIDELVRSHNLSRSCRSNVPVPKEWVREAPIEEVDFTDETLKAAQRITGELLWVSQRTRVDIAFGVGLMSSWTTKAPAFVTKARFSLQTYSLKHYPLLG
ncbi:Copia protein [Symbiodinium microadriaticum]|uniref:Copia protein n=1 Tax=Symbiodinium microadriaticum TaxID=2951 RepID=A0A1Q9D4D8_SYMMI|nr:Copia protein [Symbiodinium microadriaticum]